MVFHDTKRARTCREKKEVADLGQLMKQKNRTAKRLARSRMSSSELKTSPLCQENNPRKFLLRKKMN